MNNLRKHIVTILFVFVNAYAIISLFIPMGEGTIWYSSKYASTTYIEFIDIRKKAIIELCFIAIGIVTFVISLILFILHKKCLISIPILSLFTASMIKLADMSHYAAQYLFTADYILIVFTIISIGIDVYRIVHYLKTHPRTPRPRKPTSKERIAELEARVRELENKKDG